MALELGIESAPADPLVHGVPLLLRLLPAGRRGNELDPAVNLGEHAEATSLDIVGGERECSRGVEAQTD